MTSLRFRSLKSYSVAIRSNLNHWRCTFKLVMAVFSPTEASRMPDDAVSSSQSEKACGRESNWLIPQSDEQGLGREYSLGAQSRPKVVVTDWRWANCLETVAESFGEGPAAVVSRARSERDREITKEDYGSGWVHTWDNRDSLRHSEMKEGGLCEMFTSLVTLLNLDSSFLIQGST